MTQSVLGIIGGSGLYDMPALENVHWEAIASPWGEPSDRVLFADDHKVIRQGLVAMLQGQPDIEVVGQAADGLEAVEMSRSLRPDVVVMDVSMPKMDGVEATRRIKVEQPGVRVIGLSMLEEGEIAERMRQAGAEAFVNKAESAATLLRAIYRISDPGIPPAGAPGSTPGIGSGGENATGRTTPSPGG